MNKSIYVCLILLVFSCTADKGKINYLTDFSIFIDELEQDKTANGLINWEEKMDSFNLLVSRKNNYRLLPAEDKSLNSYINKFNKLKEIVLEEEMKVNFYFENSASMKGYLDGSNFRKIMHRIDGNLNDYDVSSYFVNTKEYLEENILNKIDAKKIKVGNTGSSDHQFVFSNAIENASGNNLSIVVTDGIYSVKGGDLGVISIDIENAFKKALKINEIETVVYKMTSNFNGVYYAEACDAEKKSTLINQNRPYYLLLFGNVQSIDKALREIVPNEELEGFNEQSRFILSKNLKADYTILTQGEEKHGDFKSSQRGASLVKSIEDCRKSPSRRSKGNSKSENYFQFAFAVDFSNIPLPDSYLGNKENYEVNNELDFKIQGINSVDSLSKNSKTYQAVKNANRIVNTNFTHIITMRSDGKFFGDLKVKLKNNLPSWIEATGIDKDCNILENTSNTFGFDKLMIGIAEAYKKTDKSKDYLEFNLVIKL